MEKASRSFPFVVLRQAGLAWGFTWGHPQTRPARRLLSRLLTYRGRDMAPPRPTRQGDRRLWHRGHLRIFVADADGPFHPHLTVLRLDGGDRLRHRDAWELLQPCVEIRFHK